LQHEMKIIRHETGAQNEDWILGLGHLLQSQARVVVGIFVKHDCDSHATNYTNVGVAQGIAYLDIRFIEPTLLAG
jgi:hypothetical protein